MKTKTCSACKVEKPVALFSVWPSYRDGYRNQCKDCRASYQRRYNSTPPGKAVLRAQIAKRTPLQRREFDLRRKYGLSNADFDAMLARQGGECAICQISTPSRVKNGKAVFHVDHCHKTGRVRGLLCASCNNLLRAFDDAEVFQRIQSYLAGI